MCCSGSLVCALFCVLAISLCAVNWPLPLCQGIRLSSRAHPTVLLSVGPSMCLCKALSINCNEYGLTEKVTGIACFNQYN